MLNVLDLLKMLNFEEFDYFYHETGAGLGREIMEEGLMVEGTNIIGTKNIAYTTVSPLLPEMVRTPRDFVVFLDNEKGSGSSRDTSEMVILCADKSLDGYLVEPYDEYHNEKKYSGIIRKGYIMGVINIDSLEFEMNEEFEFASDLVDASDFKL